ncbi:DNA-3-methyladenine glycosylase [Aestuariimicrobium kwangyangense]|uniref:DNA-3-methyladenine glycosylase n=1 Tax=Aestuariimicrobium kwangyangense TaxID=396389 RepID=UPI0003B4F917|nr:DNA-3-methyladenine glycosylase [Aestuariimicrobium kwangyangense]
MTRDPRASDPRLADPLVAARHALGGVLSTWRDGALVAIRVTEVEAYRGADDPAAHTFRGRTPRNQTMFGPSGHLYVYRHMGLHHCVNLVCSDEGLGHGLLIRAGEVIAGQQVALARRTRTGVCRAPLDLARGPARLTVALGIVHADDAVAWHPGLADADHEFGWQWPQPALDPACIRSGPRIGVPAAGADPDLFGWRFWIADDPTVSGSPALNRAGRRLDEGNSHPEPWMGTGAG